jgi:curved DNA-binding protein CbpA
MYGKVTPLARDGRALARDAECDWVDLPSPVQARHSGVRLGSPRPMTLAPPTLPPPTPPPATLPPPTLPPPTLPSATLPPATPPPATLPPSSRPPRSLPPVSSLTASVTQRHAELGRLNHFELLGIPETADRGAIVRAFQREAPRFHPDRLKGVDERLRPLAADIFRRMSEAYLVLENDETRQRYSRELELQRRANAMAEGQLEVDPDKLFQAARVCLRRERVQDAFVLMKQACRAAPHDLRYQALFAWLKVKRGVLRPGADADQILALLNRAVSRHAEDLEIRLYRARVLQRLGFSEDAFRDFSIVANADPLNVEAAREVRLHQMRSVEGWGLSRVFSKLRSR